MTVKAAKDSLLNRFKEIDDHQNVSFYIWGRDGVRDFERMVSQKSLNLKLGMLTGYKGWFSYSNDNISIQVNFESRVHIYPEMTLGNILQSSSDISLIEFSDKQVDEIKYSASFS